MMTVSKGTNDALKMIAICLGTIVANWSAITTQIENRLDVIEERRIKKDSVRFRAIIVRFDTLDTREARHYRAMGKRIDDAVAGIPPPPPTVNRTKTIITPADTAGTKAVLRDLFYIRAAMDSMRQGRPFPPYYNYNLVRPPGAMQ